MELCSIFCSSLGGKRVWGRMDTCIFMAESLCCPPETITKLLIVHTSIQYKKFNKKKKKSYVLHLSSVISIFIDL